MRENKRIKIDKSYRNIILYFSLWIGVLLLYHVGMHTMNDDLAYATFLDDSTLMEYLNMRYNTWISRIFSEGIAVVLLRMPSIVWKSLNILSWIAITIMYVSLAGKEEKEEKVLIIICIFLLYPMEHLSTAGWGTTNIFYIWPLIGVLFNCILIKKILLKQVVSKKEQVLGALLLVISANTEQLLVIMTLFWGATLIWQKCNNSVNRISLISLLVCGINACVIMISPGNKRRILIETELLMPDFFNGTFLDKVNKGIVSTMEHFIVNADLIFILLIVILMILVWERSQDTLYRTIAMFPVLVVGVWGLFREELSGKYSYLNDLLTGEIINPENYVNIALFISLIIYLLVITCIVTEFYIAFGNSIHFIVNIVILAGGFLSRIMLGFSPTLYGSKTRTFVYAYFALIASSIYVFRMLSLNVRRKILPILCGISIITFFREIICIFSL